MEKKVLKKNNLKFILIIGLLTVITLFFFTGYILGSRSIICEEKKNLNELFPSPIEIDASLSWIVEEIGEESLRIISFSETGEELESLEVLVARDVEIISEYVLPEDAPEDQIETTLSGPDGETFRLGVKEIGLDMIEPGDQVFLELGLKQDFTIEVVKAYVLALPW